ncbi:hypothetical protein [Haloechinothrix halophila]|uniref:hypothetical protein n=1 Tax=Haloechinothrix halophila TaxID=1069073 RepID=UPI0004299F42|nr:hypothetical protein [Haloechinothrix halophila]
MSPRYEGKPIAEGDLLIVARFGGGMAIGTCLLRWWPDNDEHPARWSEQPGPRI